MAKILQCNKGAFPLSHLGIPIGLNMGIICKCDYVIAKFKTRLSTWKASSLSFEGRATLIKVVLGSLPMYYLSIFKALDQVIKNRKV